MENKDKKEIRISNSNSINNDNIIINIISSKKWKIWDNDNNIDNIIDNNINIINVVHNDKHNNNNNDKKETKYILNFPFLIKQMQKIVMMYQKEMKMNSTIIFYWYLQILMKQIKFLVILYYLI